MMRDVVVQAVIAKAKSVGLEPAAALALIEVETAGATFEQDNRTPQFLYERHVAWKQAEPRGFLARFRAAGLAIPRWDRATQYRDERTSAQRLDLIGRASSIDDEVAKRSASWGLGQTMGFLAEDLGFRNAREMVEHMMGSIDGQLDCMFRELLHSHLIEPLNAHDWAHVARIYNGPSYAANNYDTRLGDAFKRWCRKLETIADRVPPPEQSLTRDQIEAIQTELRDLGYHEVGTCDGDWGTKTTGAIAAFQAHEGLPVTGHYDEGTRLALEHENPLARPVGRERSDATAEDLRQEGSKTIQHADAASLWGKLKLWLGLGGAGAAAGQGSGLLDTAHGALEQASSWRYTLKEVANSFGDIAQWALAHWWIFAIVAGLVVIYQSRQIRNARVQDHRSGTHAGPTED